MLTMNCLEEIGFAFDGDGSISFGFELSVTVDMFRWVYSKKQTI